MLASGRWLILGVLMTDEENERMWRGVHPLRAWMLMCRLWSSPPRHPKDQARKRHGKHGKRAERMHNVKRPK